MTRLSDLGALIRGDRRCIGSISWPSSAHRIFGAPAHHSCSGRLVLRQNRNNGSLFWGCTRYPNCRATVPFVLTGRLRSRLRALRAI